MWPLIDRIVLIIQVLIIFFVPYNVDRPARRLPYVTYSLMGLNVFLFFVTVFISNVNLPADRIIGRGEAARLINEEGAKDPEVSNLIESAKEMDPKAKETGKVSFEAKDDDTRPNPFSKKGQEALARYALHSAATKLAYDRANTEAGYEKAWQVEHMDSTYVLTPHYSALQWFAYRPGEPSAVGKLLGLAGSMFLHGGLMHIFFNMLFLWVFGRALEDSLGPRVYLGAYLLCGVAASLLHHIMTQLFSPEQMMNPSLGASGAIAGVMGLFAPRFYRTPVRVFYLTILAAIVGIISFGILGGILVLILRDLVAGGVAALGLVLAGLFFFGRVWAWGGTKIPAIWFLGFMVVLQDIYPVVRELSVGPDPGDNTAHWAHIGGLLLGILYAFLIGAQKEGKQEFMLEDAEKAFNLGDMAGAISYSQNILEREPGNAGAYEVMAKAWMKQNNEDEALDNYELAIENYLRVGERDKAAAAYLAAVEKYPRFILQAATQLAVGNQMAKSYDFKNAAETLVKIPYTFPDASEGEVALLRSAQLYLQHLDQPQTAIQLLQFFLQKYPESQWMPQVERAWKMAHHQMMAPPPATAEPEPEVQAPAAPARMRAQAVAPLLELEPVSAGQAGTGPSYAPQAAPPPGASRAASPGAPRYNTQPYPPQNAAPQAPPQAPPPQAAPPRPPGTA